MVFIGLRVQHRPPVVRDAAGRARGGLVGRVAHRGGELRAGLVEVLVRVGPNQHATRLVGADDRVAGLLGVPGGVLVRGVVAAADVPALGAPAQVQPPALVRLALHAAGAARRHRRVYALHFRHVPSTVVVGASSGSRISNRVSPGTDSTCRSPWCLLTTIRQAMSNPSPVPSPTGLVLKNGSKIRFLMSAGMPGPLSPISTSAQSPSRAVRMVSVPVPPIADTALSIRLVQTWLSSDA